MTIKQILKSSVIKIFPAKITASLFPNWAYKKPSYNTFISIKDSIAKKSFQMYLRQDGFIEREINDKGLYGGWEMESLKIWAMLAKNSNTIIDIGANTGAFSLIAQNNNPRARVIAIEPIDINFMVLSQNIKQNNFPVIAEKIALSEKEGIAKMFMLKDRLNYMTSVNDDRYALHPEIKGDSAVVEIEVSIKPFSYIYKKYNLDNIDLIKIDVEGHEITVLNAMMPYLEKHKPTILIEIIGDANAVKLNDMFKGLGYEFISIDEIKQSVVVDKLWDNDHHNFLICNKNTIQYLRSKQLVA